MGDQDLLVRAHPLDATTRTVRKNVKILQQMLNELESHRLHVVLAPLNPQLRGWNAGGCKRVKADQNPVWYRRFCASYPSSRGVRRGKFDTRIKRRNTERALRQLIAGVPAGIYTTDLLGFARRIAA